MFLRNIITALIFITHFCFPSLCRSGDSRGMVGPASGVRVDGECCDGARREYCQAALCRVPPQRQVRKCQSRCVSVNTYAVAKWWGILFSLNIPLYLLLYALLAFLLGMEMMSTLCPCFSMKKQDSCDGNSFISIPLGRDCKKYQICHSSIGHYESTSACDLWLDK